MNHMMLWTDLEGRELDGGWKLTRLVRPEGRNAWFEGMGPDGQPAMISITEALNDEEELLERLRAAVLIRHPNVVAVREALLSHIDDTPVVVAVMEPTEENLGDVLRERVLDVTEARQVLDALLAALTAIHGRGLVHGRMEASSVLAIGETIKLRSDCLQIAAPGSAAAAAENVRGVGRIVTQAVTRRVPAGENDPVLQLLPEPMARAVRRALSGNASAAEIAALAGTRLELMPSAAPIRSAAPATREVPTPAPASSMPASPQRVLPETPAAEPPAPQEKAPQVKREAEVGPASVLVPVEAEKEGSGAEPRGLPMRPADVRAETRPVDDRLTAGLPLFSQRGRSFFLHGATTVETDRLLEDDPPEWDRRRTAPYVIVVAVVLVLATILALHGLLHRKAKTPTAQSAASTAPAVTGLPASGAAAVAAGKPAAARPGGSVPAVAMAPAGAGWRVIAYTYDHESAAEHKAQAIAERDPQLHPAVFAPRGKALYLVTLGGVMSRASALELRNRAVQMGLPRDTYAQSFR
jgi:hypothetical protein